MFISWPLSLHRQQEWLLERLGDPVPQRVIMVGDRSHDVLGARAHGIDCIAVGWGYGTPGEFDDVRPAYLCATPGDVARALGVDVDSC